MRWRRGEIPALFRDIIEIIRELFGKLLSSRLFALAVIFICMFMVLVGKLFDLQIIHGEEIQNKYIQKTLRTVYTPGNRGKILDRNCK